LLKRTAMLQLQNIEAMEASSVANPKCQREHQSDRSKQHHNAKKNSKASTK
jgi:hypothetical protein